MSPYLSLFIYHYNIIFFKFIVSSIEIMNLIDQNIIMVEEFLRDNLDILKIKGYSFKKE